MPILVVPPGNSWVTLVEANAYMDEKPDASNWSSISNDNRRRYLIAAYRWINRLPDYSISTVTNKLKYAQIELAWYIYVSGTAHYKHEALEAQGVKAFRISKFDENLNKTGLPAIVKDLLDDYNTKAGGYFPTIDRTVSQNQ